LRAESKENSVSPGLLNAMEQLLPLIDTALQENQFGAARGLSNALEHLTRALGHGHKHRHHHRHHHRHGRGRRGPYGMGLAEYSSGDPSGPDQVATANNSPGPEPGTCKGGSRAGRRQVAGGDVTNSTMQTSQSDPGPRRCARAFSAGMKH